MNPASPASAVTVTQNGKDVDGYYKFSGYIAQDPLRSTTIFRRFDRLTARNLLYMESELAELENRLEELDDLPVHEDMEIYLQDWNLLRLQASYQDSQIPRELVIQELLREKRDLILEIRGKVKEYRKSATCMMKVLAVTDCTYRGSCEARLRDVLSQNTLRRRCYHKSNGAYQPP